MLEYRQLAKFRSTYADALFELIDPETGRIHTSYNQTVASTGRLSSSDPNLQNIPARGEWGKRFRAAFIPEKGCVFLAADYSQIELRVLAHLSGDPALIETFVAGRDVHEETANRVFGPSSGLFKEEQRRRAKIINFSMIYGASAFSLAGQLGTSNHEAQAFIDKYYETYPGVKAFLDRIVDEAAERGYSRDARAGGSARSRSFAQSDKTVRQAGRRIALNNPLQGTAADIMKKAMIDVRNELDKRGLAARMILQVHDELVFEVPEAERSAVEKIVRSRMENVCEFKVPLLKSRSAGARTGPRRNEILQPWRRICLARLAEECGTIVRHDQKLPDLRFPGRGMPGRSGGDPVLHQPDATRRNATSSTPSRSTSTRWPPPWTRTSCPGSSSSPSTWP